MWWLYKQSDELPLHSKLNTTSSAVLLSNHCPETWSWWQASPLATPMCLYKGKYILKQVLVSDFMGVGFHDGVWTGLIDVLKSIVPV